jgi:hypothetical protein
VAPWGWPCPGPFAVQGLGRARTPAQGQGGRVGSIVPERPIPPRGAETMARRRAGRESHGAGRWPAHATPRKVAIFPLGLPGNLLQAWPASQGQTGAARQDASLPAAAREAVPASGGFREAWAPLGPAPGAWPRGSASGGRKGLPPCSPWMAGGDVNLTKPPLAWGKSGRLTRCSRKDRLTRCQAGIAPNRSATGPSTPGALGLSLPGLQPQGPEAASGTWPSPDRNGADGTGSREAQQPPAHSPRTATIPATYGSQGKSNRLNLFAQTAMRQGLDNPAQNQFSRDSPDIKTHLVSSLEIPKKYAIIYLWPGLTVWASMPNVRRGKQP